MWTVCEQNTSLKVFVTRGKSLHVIVMSCINKFLYLWVKILQKFGNNTNFFISPPETSREDNDVSKIQDNSVTKTNDVKWRFCWWCPVKKVEEMSLPWRAESINKFFLKARKYVKVEQFPQARHQMKQRVLSETSSCHIPVDTSKWAVISAWKQLLFLFFHLWAYVLHDIASYV